MNSDMPAPQGVKDLWKPKRQFNQRLEQLVQVVFAAFALVSVATTVGIVLTLIFETFSFFQEVPFWKFLLQGKWTPLFPSAEFGIFVLISATILTSGIAIIVALPLGLLSAICLSEYASPRLRSILKPLLEVLAGIPSVVFGYFALLFVTPLLQNLIPGLQGFNALSAGIVLGISITPLVASLSEDAIYAVPQSLRDGAYALGATKREAVTSVVLPAALSGIVASLILAISRAIGETMIVTLAAGQNPNLGLNPFVPIQTMTSFIVQVSLGDTPHGTIAYKTIFAVGMTLFLITLCLNIFSFWFVRRFREKYD
jgi:phosphate transport system permease protein